MSAYKIQRHTVKGKSAPLQVRHAQRVPGS